MGCYKMTTRRIAQLSFAACLGLVVGCSDSPVEHKAVVETKSPPSPLEQIKSEISNLASNVGNGCFHDRQYFDGLTRRIGELPLPDREAAFNVAVEAWKNPVLKEYPLSDREKSLDAYIITASRLTSVFLLTCDFKERIWDFMLHAFSALDEEERIVGAPGFDPRNPDRGIVILPGDYLSAIFNMRFSAIREKFEANPMFGRYYHNLPPVRQKEWIERIEKAARRKVVICDPRSPDEKLPRKPFLLPSYLSESEKERRREARRKLLRAAGIDPAEEGL